MPFDKLEVSYSPCRKLEMSIGVFAHWQELPYIGAHRWRFLERNHLQAVLSTHFGILFRHVAQCNLVFWNLNLEFKSGFQVWLIETGKGSPRIACLELGTEHVVVIAVFSSSRRWCDSWLVLGAVKACHSIVDGSLEVNGKDGILGSRYLFGETESCSFIGGININLGSFPFCRCVHKSLISLEIVPELEFMLILDIHLPSTECRLALLISSSFELTTISLEAFLTAASILTVPL
jgi:hypothetical protein